MKTISHFIWILAFSIFLIVASSCKVKRKEYIERNGLHSGEKPHEMAAEIGKQQKNQKRAYRRQLYKSWKKMHPGEKRSANPYR